MRAIISLAVGLGIFWASGLPIAEAFFQGNAERRIAKPAPPIVAQSTFELKVETKPRFPNENRPPASTEVEEKSLAVTIQPEKKEFAGNGPLAFLVTFENTSKQPMMLFGLEHLGVSPKLVISNQTNANQWSISGKFDQTKNPPAVELGPGDSKTYTLVVEAKAVIIPMPLPRPIPLPRPLPEPVIQKGAEPPAERKIWPPRPPVVIAPALPVGEGECRARLFLEFQTDPIRRYKHPTWTGKIATGTVDFKIGKSEPGQVPPINGGGAVTKERAIALALAAAERALDANYQPVEGLKPTHHGSWITDAEKTATITEKKDGWTIGWTHFPKKGFSYNVKVDVSITGAATVREVFTGYSK